MSAPTPADRLRGLVDRVRAEPAVVLLALAVIIWFVVFGRLIWQRHDRFATFDFDMGHHDQAIWLLAHGKGFITVSGMPVLGHHFTLAYFAVAPLFWLGGGPQLLNLLQTAALALSAVPLFLYARDRLGNEWLALTFGVAWLLNPTVQWLCWEAWHPETMAIPFLLMTWLMATRRRYVWYWVFLIAALMWKEDIALAAIGLGVVLLVRKQRRLGVLTMVVGVAWFLFAYGVAMPAFNGGTNQAGIFYGELGDSPADLIKTTFTNPTMILDRLDNNDALGYARDLLAPWGFTSLLAPLLLVPAIPQFFANILTNLNFFWSIQFHYAAIIVTFVALASVDGVARLKSLPWRRFAVGAGRRRRPGDDGCLGHVADQHAIPQRLLAARRQRPPVGTGGGGRRRALRCGRIGHVQHRAAPQPPRADLHVPQSVVPAQLGSGRGRSARPRSRPRPRRGGLAGGRSNDTRPRRARGATHRRSDRQWRVRGRLRRGGDPRRRASAASRRRADRRSTRRSMRATRRQPRSGRQRPAWPGTQ